MVEKKLIAAGILLVVFVGMLFHFDKFKQSSEFDPEDLTVQYTDRGEHKLICEGLKQENNLSLNNIILSNKSQNKDKSTDKNKIIVHHPFEGQILLKNTTVQKVNCSKLKSGLYTYK